MTRNKERMRDRERERERDGKRETDGHKGQTQVPRRDRNFNGKDIVERRKGRQN